MSGSPPLARWLDLRWAPPLVLFVSLAIPLTVLAASHETLRFDERLLAEARSLGGWYDPIGNIFDDILLPILVALWIVSIPVAWWLGRSDLALLFVSAGVVRYALQAFKPLAGRTRPDLSDERSFPSGHVMTIAVFTLVWFVIVAELLPRRWAWMVRAVIVAAIFLMALTRTWDNAHWPSDGLGAALWSAAALGLLMLVRPTLTRVSARIPSPPGRWPFVVGG